MTHITCHTAVLTRASDADLFSLHEKRTACRSVQVAAAVLQVTLPTILLLQERLRDKNKCLRRATAGEDPHCIGLSLEYIFGSFVSKAEEARATAKLCIGEQVLTVSLKLSCDLLLSTSQGWTLQEHVDTSLTHACSDGLLGIALEMPQSCHLITCLLSTCNSISPLSAVPSMWWGQSS